MLWPLLFASLPQFSYGLFIPSEKTEKLSYHEDVCIKELQTKYTTLILFIPDISANLKSNNLQRNTLGRLVDGPSNVFTFDLYDFIGGEV